MVNKFTWKTKSNIIEYTSIFQIKNAVNQSTRDSLIKEILNFKDKTVDNSGSEKNCWRGHPVFSHSHVEDLILTAVDTYIDSLPDSAIMSRNEDPSSRFDYQKPLIHYWTNVNSKGGYNVSHNHSGSVISGVIYLQANQTGMIEFQPLNYIYKINHPCWFYNGSMQYYPEDGDIILFPSYLLHSVEPNPIEKERINIAFNINYALR